MTNRFENKVALVTGAASGIGAAIANGLVAEGASVVGADINADLLAEAERRLGKRFVAVRADVTAEADVEHAVTSAVERFGALHLGFNVAGSARLARLLDMKETDRGFTVDFFL